MSKCDCIRCIIDKLDVIKSELAGDIKKYFKKDDSYFYFEFLKIQKEDDVLKILKNINEKSLGLYYFEVKFLKDLKVKDEFIENMDKLWNNDSVEYSPKFYKKKAEKNLFKLETDEWIPFYLGKSKDLKKRLKEHIYYPSNKKTYSMKLYKRKDKLNNMKFRVTYYCLDELSSKEYYFVVELIEKELREEYCPIIGKQ